MSRHIENRAALLFAVFIVIAVGAGLWRWLG